MNSQGNKSPKENAWWFIPTQHINALRALERKLNGLVRTEDVLTRDKALETLREYLTKKDSENANQILEHFIRYYNESNSVLSVNDESLNFRIKCDLIGNYSNDFAYARIILECLFKYMTKI